MAEQNQNKLIHVACIQEESKNKKTYLFLFLVNTQKYIWFKEDSTGNKIETTLSGMTFDDAMNEAVKFWKKENFRTINCGFRYSLPERDEHGVNALFHQMAASYSSMTGIYFDDTVGYNCIVYHASIEARDILKRNN
ncbi:MAG: hypothetical protein H0W88_03770 [Parachlamydiaceae bacterium]|nr:hypothetical protein [Parachlamydiaceae bacterium]